jgi:predicted TIM-barrel fold metal-dependent hydrolase
MFIDGHAHAAGMYATVESILQSSKNHEIEKVVLCTSPKNNINLYFDTSGSQRIRVRDIQEGIDLVGYDHVLFGTDTPYAKIEDQIRKMEQLALSDREKEHIFRLNIANLLSLND